MKLFCKLPQTTRDLVRAFSQSELMTRVQSGLLTSLRPLIRQFQMNFNGPNALAEFLEYESSIHTSQQAVVGSMRPPRGTKDIVFESM